MRFALATLLVIGLVGILGFDRLWSLVPGTSASLDSVEVLERIRSHLVDPGPETAWSARVGRLDLAGSRYRAPDAETLVVRTEPVRADVCHALLLTFAGDPAIAEIRLGGTIVTPLQTSGPTVTPGDTKPVVARHCAAPGGTIVEFVRYR